MARIAEVSATNTSITVKIVELSGDYTGEQRTYGWFLDGEGVGSMKTLKNTDTESAPFTFTNLEPDTQYHIATEISYKGTGDTHTSYVYLEIELSTLEGIAAWDWNISNGYASAEATQLAFETIRNKGTVEQFGYEVWNDIVEKVREVQREIGYSWDTSNGEYLNFSQTKMRNNDRILTADRFNSLRHNIEFYYARHIHEVSKGDIVKGKYFEEITDWINDWIQYEGI